MLRSGRLDDGCRGVGQSFGKSHRGAWPGAYSENWTLLVRARALDGVRWTVGAGRTGRRDATDDNSVITIRHRKYFLLGYSIL